MATPSVAGEPHGRTIVFVEDATVWIMAADDPRSAPRPLVPTAFEQAMSDGAVRGMADLDNRAVDGLLAVATRQVDEDGGRVPQ